MTRDAQMLLLAAAGIANAYLMCLLNPTLRKAIDLLSPFLWLAKCCRPLKVEEVLHQLEAFFSQHGCFIVFKTRNIVLHDAFHLCIFVP